jgi:hypothetical protein
MKRLLLLLPLLLLFAPAHAATGDVTLPLCSAAMHDAYTATGPDGTLYPTWHPQIDPSGCHFDHEHGSNPALFKAGVRWQPGSGYWPVYGYSASAVEMSEGHTGFKSYAFERAGYKWLITHHFGTGNAPLAACTQMHTVDVAARDASGAIVADLHLMADFGRSVSNRSGANLTPTACPNQAALAGASTGIRQFPAMDNDNVGYEPWRMDSRPLPFFSSNDTTFNTPDAQTACDAISCTLAIPRTEVPGLSSKGAFRFLTVGLRIHATVAYSGTFTWQGATQYIAPGFDVTIPGAACFPYGTDYWYDCSGAVNDEGWYKRSPLITGAN